MRKPRFHGKLPGMTTSVTVLGLGYVGLPTAALLASRGLRVHGVDTSAAVRATLAAGRSHIAEADVEALLERALRAGLFTLHAEPPPADVFVIAVPTPLGPGHAPMLGHVLDAARALAPALRSGDLVLLESTSPIGTTARIAELLRGLRPELGEVHVAYGPERVLPGRILAELVENDRVAGGLTPEATRRAVAFYRLFVRGEVHATDAATAEMVKLSENAFRDVNIAFANELSLIAGRHELDVWRVIELANRHPRVNILKPGPGVGGHCIAVDPWFLAHGAPEAARLIPAARAVDAAKRAAVLEQASALCAAGERVICLGLAFKGDVDDLRESPALAIAAALAQRHPGLVVAVEPHLDAPPAGLEAPLLSLDAALELPGTLLVLTDHRVFARLPPAALAGRRIIDTRGIFRRPIVPHREENA
ncbi:nucleotide sugar dehydrogenase [Roseococcus sp. SYP-B2431]|uniref:nucleotide sugar dehydrogenase n=1 Tax=Roseococcus sp. SYP-B2431 TaxID=2496640 RepID=UPI00197CC76B|nr:nucleotide sugar dehydrogenase [Roseococcus sp. SYP-B2431]